MADSELIDAIENECIGLIYVSEIDAAVKPFAGPVTDVIVPELIMGSSGNTNVEEGNFEELCKRLATVREWHNEVQKERAKKFQKLFQLLQENLRQIKVYRIGRTRLDIYVLGLDESNRAVGVQTQAVET